MRYMRWMAEINLTSEHYNQLYVPSIMWAISDKKDMKCIMESVVCYNFICSFRVCIDIKSCWILNGDDQFFSFTPKSQLMYASGIWNSAHENH